MSELLRIFHELGIGDDLYGIDSYKRNAFNLIYLNDSKYVVEFIDSQKEIILKTRELDLAEALFVMFKWVYMLHIMKIHLTEMQKIGLLTDGVTIEDYKVLLT